MTTAKIDSSQIKFISGKKVYLKVSNNSLVLVDGQSVGTYITPVFYSGVNITEVDWTSTETTGSIDTESNPLHKTIEFRASDIRPSDIGVISLGTDKMNPVSHASMMLDSNTGYWVGNPSAHGPTSTPSAGVGLWRISLGSGVIRATTENVFVNGGILFIESGQPVIAMSTPSAGVGLWRTSIGTVYAPSTTENASVQWPVLAIESTGSIAYV